MDLADIKICKTLIINIVYFADSLNSYAKLLRVILILIFCATVLSIVFLCYSRSELLQIFPIVKDNAFILILQVFSRESAHFHDVLAKSISIL